MALVKKQDCPSLRLEIQCEPTFCHATVIVPACFVDTIYNHVTHEQKMNIETQGFGQGNVPVDYIKQNFHEPLIEHLKEFLFNYFVISFLFEEIRNRKLLVAGSPRVLTMNVTPGKDAHFSFELSLFPEIQLREWKYFPFNEKKKKNYKDLDRQVESFVQEERDYLKTHQDNIVHIGDWIRFSLSLVDEHQMPLLEHKEILWFRMGDEEVDNALRSIFLDKKTGDVFCSISQDLQQFFSHRLDAHYTFYIEILDVLHHSYFCLDQFKKQFKLKTNKEMHQKLIEVFSYRNNISQRRAMAEESLKLLLNKHRFNVPVYLVIKKQKRVLNAVKANPDYHVYRVQKDFKERVRQLAEKQTKEKVILDHVAYNENVSVSDQDIKCYLNLLNRPRTKEFIYFDPPSTKHNGQEVPISEEELKRICLREKTLNHIIYHLTKK